MTVGRYAKLAIFVHFDIYLLIINSISDNYLKNEKLFPW